MVTLVISLNVSCHVIVSFFSNIRKKCIYVNKIDTETFLCLQPNLPCVDNMAFDMDRMSRSQTSSQRTALVDLSSETSISLEPLRHSSSSQLPSDEELIPRSGEINIAVTSKSRAYSLLFCLSCSVMCEVLCEVLVLF